MSANTRLAIILGYYLMLTTAETLGQQGRAPVLVTMWMPNVVLGGIGLALFVRSAKELPLPGEGMFASWIDRARVRLAMQAATDRPAGSSES